MLSINSILCPTDFSEFSDRALVYATDLSARWMAKLYVQHVMDATFMMAPDVSTHVTDIRPKREAYEREIEAQLSKRLAPGTSYSKLITGGNPAEEILRVAREHAVDLIVMGTHGRRGLRRWMLGSVTERVVQRAPCPVLAVCHVGKAPERPIVFRRILIGTERVSSRAEESEDYTMAANHQKNNRKKEPEVMVFKPLSHSKEAEEYFYKKGQELIRNLRRAADRERKQRALEQRKAQHWMKCPKCGAAMQEIEQYHIKVDQCTECQGLYFDRGELEIFTKMQKKEDFLTRLGKRWEKTVAKTKYFPL